MEFGNKCGRECELFVNRIQVSIQYRCICNVHVSSFIFRRYFLFNFETNLHILERVRFERRGRNVVHFHIIHRLLFYVIMYNIYYTHCIVIYYSWFRIACWNIVEFVICETQQYWSLEFLQEVQNSASVASPRRPLNGYSEKLYVYVTRVGVSIWEPIARCYEAFHKASDCSLSTRKTVS